MRGRRGKRITQIKCNLIRQIARILWMISATTSSKFSTIESTKTANISTRSSWNLIICLTLAPRRKKRTFSQTKRPQNKFILPHHPKSSRLLKSGKRPQKLDLSGSQNLILSLGENSLCLIQNFPTLFLGAIQTQ